jgi:hypothetical protein
MQKTGFLHMAASIGAGVVVGKLMPRDFQSLNPVGRGGRTIVNAEDSVEQFSSRFNWQSSPVVIHASPNRRRGHHRYGYFVRDDSRLKEMTTCNIP